MPENEIARFLHQEGVSWSWYRLSTSSSLAATPSTRNEPPSGGHRRVVAVSVAAASSATRAPDGFAAGRQAPGEQ
jgi:hypothetical protein